jgi:hypothetical protein
LAATVVRTAFVEFLVLFPFGMRHKVHPTGGSVKKNEKDFALRARYLQTQFIETVRSIRTCAFINPRTSRKPDRAC